MKLVPKLASIDDLLAGRCGEVAVGDVLAFNGVSRVDEFIQGATDSAISHVAIVHPRTATRRRSRSWRRPARGHRHPARRGARRLPDRPHLLLPAARRRQSRALVVPSTLAAYYVSNALDKYNYDGVVEAGLYDLDHPLLRAAARATSTGIRRSRGSPGGTRLFAEAPGSGSKVFEGIPTTGGSSARSSSPRCCRPLRSSDPGRPARAGGPGRGLLVRHLRRRLSAQRRAPCPTPSDGAPRRLRWSRSPTAIPHGPDAARYARRNRRRNRGRSRS